MGALRYKGIRTHLEAPVGDVRFSQTPGRKLWETFGRRSPPKPPYWHRISLCSTPDPTAFEFLGLRITVGDPAGVSRSCRDQEAPDKLWGTLALTAGICQLQAPSRAEQPTAATALGSPSETTLEGQMEDSVIALRDEEGAASMPTLFHQLKHCKREKRKKQQSCPQRT